MANLTEGVGGGRGHPRRLGLKRPAGGTQDRADLEALERTHGALPIEPIPSLDDNA